MTENFTAAEFQDLDILIYQQDISLYLYVLYAFIGSTIERLKVADIGYDVSSHPIHHVNNDITLNQVRDFSFCFFASSMIFSKPRIRILLTPTISPLPLVTQLIHSPSPSPTKSVTRTFKPQLLLRCRPTPLPYATSTKMETNNKDLELSNLFDVKGKVALVTGGGWSIPQSHLP